MYRVYSSGKEQRERAAENRSRKQEQETKTNTTHSCLTAVFFTQVTISRAVGDFSKSRLETKTAMRCLLPSVVSGKISRGNQGAILWRWVDRKERVRSWDKKRKSAIERLYAVQSRLRTVMTQSSEMKINMLSGTKWGGLFVLEARVRLLFFIAPQYSRRDDGFSSAAWCCTD